MDRGLRTPLEQEMLFLPCFLGPSPECFPNYDHQVGS